MAMKSFTQSRKFLILVATLMLLFTLAFVGILPAPAKCGSPVHFSDVVYPRTCFGVEAMGLFYLLDSNDDLHGYEWRWVSYNHLGQWIELLF